MVLVLKKSRLEKNIKSVLKAINIFKNIYAILKFDLQNLYGYPYFRITHIQM